MAVGRDMYNFLFHRTSTFALTIVMGALFFKRFLDQGSVALYKHLKRGKLWKHIKHKYKTDEN